MEHRSPRTAAGGLSQRQGMGILFGVYLSFGLSPLYWNLLHGVSALEMVSHRSLWGSLIIAAFMVWKGQFPAFFPARSGIGARSRLSVCAASPISGTGGYTYGPSPTARCSNAAWDTTSFL